MKLKKFLKNFLICEDARFDNTGKPLLIGIFASHINTPAFPLQIKSLFSFCELDTKGKKIENFEFCLKDEKGETLHTVRVNVNTLDWKQVSPFIFSFPQTVFHHPGTYHIEVRDPIEQTEWEVVRSLSISKVEVLAEMMDPNFQEAMKKAAEAYLKSSKEK